MALVITDMKADAKSDKVQVTVPDFDFPEDVVAHADSLLEAAYAQGDARLMVVALTQRSLARMSVSKKALPELRQQLQQTRDRADVTADYRSLLCYLEALMVKDEDKEECRRLVRQSLDPLGNGDVTALCQPVSRYPDILVPGNEVGNRCVPMLYDVLMLRSMSLLSDYGDTVTLPSFYQRWLDVHKADTDVLPRLFIETQDWHEAASEQCFEAYASFDDRRRSLFDKYRDHPECGLLLLAGDMKDEDYPYFQYYRQHFSQSSYFPAVRAHAAVLEATSVRFSYPDVVQSVDSIEVTLQTRNVHRFDVLLCRVPDALYEKSQTMRDRSERVPLDALEVVATQNVSLPQPEADGHPVYPFDLKEQHVTFAPQPYGRYVVLARYETPLSIMSPEQQRTVCSELSYYDVAGKALVVSDLRMLAVRTSSVKIQTRGKGDQEVLKPQRNDLFVVDSRSGRPQPDAQVIVTGGHSRWTRQSRPILGKDKYLPPAYFSTNDNDADKPLCDHHVQFFTDLGIYRPGETVQVSLLAWEVTATRRSPWRDKKLTLLLKDANYQEVQQLTVTTDDFGHATASFVLPTDRLLGTYHLLTDQGGRHSFEVSEYKVPTFQVDMSDTPSTQPQDGAAVIRGRVMTYAGVPVAGAEVNVTLESRTWWFYDEPSSAHTFRCTTDAQGCFTYECPSDWTRVENNDHLPFWRRYRHYHVTATCTNAAGESQQGESSFGMGVGRALSLADGNYLLPDRGTLHLPVAFRSTDPVEVSARCRYTLCNDQDEVVKEGAFQTDRPDFAWHRLPSGRYTLRCWLSGADDAVAQTPDLQSSLVLYREQDALPPVPSALWMPEPSREVTARGQVRVLLGTTEQSHVYYVAMGRQGELSSGWLAYKPGMHWFTMPMPKGSDQWVTLYFYCWNNGKLYTETMSLDSPRREAVKVQTVTFRDKVLPGSREHWQLRLTDADGNPMQGRMMLDIYSRALETLHGNVWQFRPSLLMPLLFVCDANDYEGNSYNVAQYTEPVSAGYGYSLEAPAYQLYGRGFYGYRRSRVYMAKRMGVYADDAMPMVSSAPATGNMLMASESSAVDDAMMAEADMSSTDNAGTVQQPLLLRQGQTHVALWQPRLESDADGYFTLDFEVPSDNTTWQMQALAYTATLASDIFRAEVLAQRPVMVQPSLPRFVRQGDVVTLTSNVMNSTDDTCQVQTTVEVFDPRSGQVLSSDSRTVSLAARGTDVVSLTYTVPMNQPYVGFRVRATTADGIAGDGEQQLLPVLPSVSPLIETKPFYLRPNQATFAHDITDTPADNAASDSVRVTLEYSDNPLWYCVTALPTVAASDAVTSTGLAHRLYALAMVQHLAATHPQVQQALRQWLSQRDTTGITPLALQSQLKQREELQITTLQASPWLPEAERQEAQMAALGQLFDSAQSTAALDKVLDQLEALQQPDGGLSWIDMGETRIGEDRSRSSFWATGVVVELIHEMMETGCCSDATTPAAQRLQRLLRQAVAYLDGEALRLEDEMLQQARRDKTKVDYLHFFPYLYAVSVHNTQRPQSDKLQSLHRHTLDAVEKDWGTMTFAARASVARLLWQHGRQAKARRVVESLRQFALRDVRQGMYWEHVDRYEWCRPVACTAAILRAFAQVDARPEELDAIRQWLLLEKQTSDWGGSSMAAEAIHALLTTGSDWLASAGNAMSADTATVTPSFRIVADGCDLAVEPADRRLGYVRLQLPNGTRHVEVQRTAAGSHPAWGAVYVQRVAPMTTVEAVASEQLKVQKRIVTAAGDSVLRVGQRVEVQFVIDCERDLEYVCLHDERAVFLEPADQLSGYRHEDASTPFWWMTSSYYLESRDEATNLFFQRLTAGRHVISYPCYVTHAGCYSVGVATLQSQYAPQHTAHSAGFAVEVKSPTR